MRSLTILLLLLFSPLVLSGQLVKGTVLDKESGSPVSLAAIYFNGTFAGTTSDPNGNFELDVSRYKSMPLTISAVGYYSLTLRDYSVGEPIKIYLIPKVYELGEVVVTEKTSKKDRKKNLNLFRREFLGTTSNGRRCEILNEEDISFLSSDHKDTLQVIALKPILIHNTALGYNITYYLDEFECCNKNKSLFFSGNIQFTEDLFTQRRFSERRRRLAYFGSRMHFFRALWSDDLDSNHFTVRDSTATELECQNLIIQGEGLTKYLKYPETLHISFYENRSRLFFLKEQVFFDKDGFFDPVGISWAGNMARKRIGDWLPYEYSVE